MWWAAQQLIFQTQGNFGSLADSRFSQGNWNRTAQGWKKKLARTACKQTSIYSASNNFKAEEEFQKPQTWIKASLLTKTEKTKTKKRSMQCSKSDRSSTCYDFCSDSHEVFILHSVYYSNTRFTCTVRGGGVQICLEHIDNAVNNYFPYF